MSSCNPGHKLSQVLPRVTHIRWGGVNGDCFLVRLKAHCRCVPVVLIFPTTPAVNLKIKKKKLDETKNLLH